MKSRPPIMTVLRRGVIQTGVLFVTCAALFADEPSLKIVERWHTVFAEEEIQLTASLTAAMPGRILWSHSVNNRTLSSGEAEAGQAPQQDNLTIKLRCPPLREGVALATELTVHFVPQKAREPAASCTHDLIIFPRDPFVGQQEWLKQLQIDLYDPIGASANVLTSMNVPFRKITNPELLKDEGATGLLIIGEGTSLIKNRSLAATLFQAAERGRKVLLLAPSDGSLPFPGSVEDAGTVQPQQLRMGRQEMITELNKTLDATDWRSPDQTIPSNGLRLAHQRSGLVLNVEQSAAAWPWMAVRYPNNGEIVICGFQIIQNWENGPTPRTLFLEILKTLDQHTDRSGTNTQSDR